MILLLLLTGYTSVVGIAKLLPHFAGFMLVKEIETLSSLLENPKRPLGNHWWCKN